jgi:hypothetical protein
MENRFNGRLEALRAIRRYIIRNMTQITVGKDKMEGKRRRERAKARIETAKDFYSSGTTHHVRLESMQSIPQAGTPTRPRPRSQFPGEKNDFRRGIWHKNDARQFPFDSSAHCCTAEHGKMADTEVAAGKA